MIQIYDTKEDFPIDNGKPRDDDIPCNICSMLKVRQGKLEWSQIMRSNDVLLGMPYNFIQFTLSLCKDETEKIFKEIYERMKSLTSSAVVEGGIYSLPQLDSGYTVYDNMMLIIASYVAKKKQNDDLVTELMNECTNKVYVAMWDRWNDRKRK